MSSLFFAAISAIELIACILGPGIVCYLPFHLHGSARCLELGKLPVNISSVRQSLGKIPVNIPSVRQVFVFQELLRTFRD